LTEKTNPVAEFDGVPVPQFWRWTEHPRCAHLPPYGAAHRLLYGPRPVLPSPPCATAHHGGAAGQGGRGRSPAGGTRLPVLPSRSGRCAAGRLLPPPAATPLLRPRAGLVSGRRSRSQGDDEMNLEHLESEGSVS
jgi:hypothetical protein